MLRQSKAAQVDYNLHTKLNNNRGVSKNTRTCLFVIAVEVLLVQVVLCTICFFLKGVDQAAQCCFISQVERKCMVRLKTGAAPTDVARGQLRPHVVVVEQVCGWAAWLDHWRSVKPTCAAHL